MFTRQWLILALLVFATVFLFINLFPRFYMRKPQSYHRLQPIPNVNNVVYESILKRDVSTTSISKEKDDRCEVIHIGIVCSGYGSNLNLHTLLKSIYFYRVNPIHFHIITNQISAKILKIMFETWNVPQVEVTFYDLEDLSIDVRWIPNSHYSGIHGLMKLMFPKIIPLEVAKKILILDTDLTVVTDIYELWTLFKNFNKKQAIGIVENQSDYYFWDNVWPAINRGFNSGVMLLNLELLKKLNWPKLWSDITKRDASIYGSTRLADQDIINAVLKEYPELLFEVPCVWNTQLSDHTLSYNCYQNQKIKIIHWNSPKKYNVENRDGDYFRSIATGYMEYNGNLFRKKLQFCDNTATAVVNETYELCAEFHPTTPWRTLLFFRDYKYENIDSDITFVAQLSYDRLQTIEELIKLWPGPISLTLYVSDSELVKSINFISNSGILNQRENVAYHAVFKDGDYYPINTLRNIGLRNVNTPYVFLADIDFLPSKNLYENLVNYIQSMGYLRKKALVVPAFEIKKYGEPVPRTKRQLLKSVKKQNVIPFLMDIWAPGHAPTNFEMWKTALKPYTVKWEPDYEPYIIVEKNVVEYNEKFVGFGWNKVSHIMELEAQNYEFIVLPDVFIVHKPHAPSYDIARFRSSLIYRTCLQMLKEEFIHKLNKDYNRSFEYTNSSISFTSMAFKRRKRNFNPSDRHTTVETNTDYPFNTE